MNSATAIDFAGINFAAIGAARELLSWFLPGGKFHGHEYVVENPTRADKTPGSFKINVRNGVWSDFATGDKGSDFISLIAYLHRCGQSDAARTISSKLGVPLSKAKGSLNGDHSNGVRPSSAASVSSSNRSNQTTAASNTPKIYKWPAEGPPHRLKDEVRRHRYKNSDGKTVKIKFKLNIDCGKYVQVYSVPEGWQQKQPADYLPVPYVAAGIDPFDAEYYQIFWPEGERDVDSLGKLGLAAFTFGGVGDGLPNGIASYLAGHHLVILADNDDVGRAHAEKKQSRHKPPAPLRLGLSAFLICRQKAT